MRRLRTSSTLFVICAWVGCTPIETSSLAAADGGGNARIPAEDGGAQRSDATSEAPDATPAPEDAADATPTTPPGSSDEPDPMIARAGTTCSQELAKACGGHASVDKLICQNGKWAHAGSCDGKNRCDTRVGTTLGTCQAIAPDCQNRNGGDTLCRDGKRLACDADTLRVEEMPCPRGSRCIEQKGGTAACECELGFELDDSDTCANVDDCIGQSCGEGGTCKDGVNEYTCECKTGFTKAGPRSCVDANAKCRTCTSEYTCVESSDHYVCLGQYLQSPMPDSLAEAKTPARYKPSAQTVLDEVTGLTWQRMQPAVYAGCTGRDPQNASIGAEGMSCRWLEAKAYCAALMLDGSGGFRLPTKIELESIIDFGRTAPMMDTSVFPPGDDRIFWTSSTSASGADRAWTINFEFGYSYPRPSSEANFVRCVR